MIDLNGNIVVDPYSTHQALLTAAVAATSGPVIELGGGLYSTPLLRALCLAQGRKLLTIDSDRDWLARVFATDGPLHTAQIIDWADLHRHGELLTCSVCLVDLAPASMRGEIINVMRRWAEIIVVHDVEVEQRHNYPGMEAALASFRYRIEDRRRGPWTAAVSDTFDVNTLREAIA